MSITPSIVEQPAQPKTGRLLRQVFSFPVALSALLAVLAVLTVRGRFNDPDMWWHLKLGEVIWTTHAIPATDLFSYTASRHPVVPQEWFPELLLYGAYHFGGYSGLMLWLCSFSALLLVAAHALCSVYSRNSKVAFLGALIVWLFSTVGLAARPQLIGYLLLVVELLLLHLGRSRNPRWFLALPPLMVLWVNCHGSFFLGLLVLGLHLFCSFFNFRRGSLVCIGENPQRRMLLWALGLSAGAVFVNPGGWKQVFYPIDTLLRQPVNLAAVQEWQPLTLADPRGVLLMGVLVVVFIILLLRRTEVLFLDELLLLAAGSWLALRHQRMVFVFGILAAPVICRMLAPLWDAYHPEKDRIAPNAVLLAFAAGVIFFAFPRCSNLVKQVNEKNPTGAVAYIQDHHLSGNMINSYAYGGYLIWALPQHPVFIDGRADLYEWAGVLAPFGQWATLQSSPTSLLDKYHVAFCVLQRGSAIAQVMTLLSGWQQAYSDQQSVIFVRSKPAH